MSNFFRCKLRRNLFVVAFVSAIGLEILGVIFHLHTRLEDYSFLSIGVFFSCIGLAFISYGNEISMRQHVKGLVFKVIGYLWVVSFVFSIGYNILALFGV